MTLFDTHCHLTDPGFPDPAGVVERARAAGVKLMLTVGLDREDCRKAVALAEQFEGLSAGIGIHPHEADRFRTDDVGFLRDLAKNPRVRGIGETGLDFFRDYAQRDNQRRAFHAQIELARELDLPLILHVRDAYPEALAILKEHDYYRGVFHCYSGDRAFALGAVQLGFYVSFSGSITYGGRRLADAVRSLPRDRIMIETDAPYLTPVPCRGKVKNEPALVRHTLAALSRILGLAETEASEFLTENGRRLFGVSA